MRPERRTAFDVVGAAFRAGDGALGVLYGDGALRVALLGLDGGRVVEEAACVSTAAAGGTALAVVGDRFAVGAADGSCAVVKARLCAVLGQAAIARDLDLPASEAGEPVTALAVRTRRRNCIFSATRSRDAANRTHPERERERALRRRRARAALVDARTGAPVSAFRAPAPCPIAAVVVAATWPPTRRARPGSSPRAPTTARRRRCATTGGAAWPARRRPPRLRGRRHREGRLRRLRRDGRAHVNGTEGCD